MAACRVLDAATATAVAGATLVRDAALSGDAGALPGGPAGYIQDDCAYDTGGAGGVTLRLVLFEPARQGTAVQGRQAFDWAASDLTANGHATLENLPGLGDAARVWAPAGQSFAEVLVLDHEVALAVDVEGLSSPADTVVHLARLVLARADSGAANGKPGS